MRKYLSLALLILSGSGFSVLGLVYATDERDMNQFMV